MVWTMLQYGPLFNGPAGVAIPIGLPLLAVIGYILWKDTASPDAMEEHNDAFSGENEAEPAAPADADAGGDD